MAFRHERAKKEAEHIESDSDDDDYVASEHGDEREQDEVAASSSGRVSPVILTRRRECTLVHARK
jgi:hypothetical protein